MTHPFVTPSPLLNNFVKLNINDDLPGLPQQSHATNSNYTCIHDYMYMYTWLHLHVHVHGDFDPKYFIYMYNVHLNGYNYNYTVHVYSMYMHNGHCTMTCMNRPIRLLTFRLIITYSPPKRTNWPRLQNNFRDAHVANTALLFRNFALFMTWRFSRVLIGLTCIVQQCYTLCSR